MQKNETHKIGYINPISIVHLLQKVGNIAYGMALTT
jgi:hypothetical protein